MRKISLLLAVAILSVLTLCGQNKIRFGVISDVHTGITPVLGAGNNLCLQNAFDYFSDPALRVGQLVVV
jgi:hypothetical protein